MPYFGSKLDKYKRYNTLLYLTILQNVGMLTSALLFLSQLLSEFNMATFHFYLSLLIFLECTYEISNKLVSQVSIRRDWIVVIAEKNAEEYRVVLDWCGAWMLRCPEAQKYINPGPPCIWSPHRQDKRFMAANR